ncbi:putative anti-sigma regulatory factor (serine/threonine protein kinase) [Synechococcus sp. BL107]|uniref:ATP-binding protein n=1 Tax=Synechococcus sp. BL107 TaxID=313625 RepID=UPI0000E544A2|nr:putative anti-sigma regulatory factor (serine/threonine protein kinase) [Synechococcus sp. BL107]
MSNEVGSKEVVAAGRIVPFHRFRWADFVLPSTLQLAPLLELLVEPVGCEMTSQKVELGLHEALVNAVRHGNSENPQKQLRVRRILTPNWLIWQVQDEGCGLPPTARAAELPLSVDAQHGRGLFLIHQCFDDVRWSRRGNRLQLACRRPD